MGINKLAHRMNIKNESRITHFLRKEETNSKGIVQKYTKEYFQRLKLIIYRINYFQTTSPLLFVIYSTCCTVDACQFLFSLIEFAFVFFFALYFLPLLYYEICSSIVRNFCVQCIEMKTDD